MPSVVNIFNAASVPIYININNSSTQLNVPAANSTTWAPGVPTTNPPFTNSSPAPGSFGYGINHCTITPSTGDGPALATVNVSDSINPADAIQLYLFYQSANLVSWMLLDNGRAVAGNLSFAAN
jgi:hypothetical protein